MKKNYKIIAFILGFLGFAALLVFLVQGHNFAMLSPKGFIAFEQKKIILSAFYLMFLVVVPVFVATIYIIRNYRSEKNNQDYKPKLVASPLSAIMLWLVSITTIFIIGLVIWESSHRLDPYKKIESTNKELTIQVVALNWKWLFIYPEQGIATVNYIQIPKDVPIHFRLTADAPMNTFWIPELGGQMYAMTGMENHLYLIANKTGEFNGSATEINGKGYAGMRFKTVAVEQQDFNDWVKEVQSSSSNLDMETYNNLAKDSENVPPKVFASVTPNLFYEIINKFMDHMGSTKKNNEPHMQMQH